MHRKRIGVTSTGKWHLTGNGVLNHGKRATKQKYRIRNNNMKYLERSNNGRDILSLDSHIKPSEMDRMMDFESLSQCKLYSLHLKSIQTTW